MKGWTDSKTMPNPFLSQIVWGGAGMLARAVVYDQPYTPHPIRRRMFGTAGLLIAGEDASQHVMNLVAEKQVAMRTSTFGGDQRVSLQVSLPAFASQVIRESSKPADLITVALQLREEYKVLRDWLNEYQMALRTGDFEDVNRYQSILRSVSKYADGRIGKVGNDAPTFTAGIDFFKVAVKADPINRIQNQIGVRALINRLVFFPSRHADLQKLLSLFDHRTSPTGLRVTDYFLRKI